MRKKYIVFLLIFLACLYGLSYASHFYPSKGLLFAENRMVAEKPSLTKESLFDNSYFKDLEIYLSDSFFKRSEWIKFSTKLDLKYFKRPFVNGIYVGKEYLLNRQINWGREDYQRKSEEMADGYGDLQKKLKEKNIYFLYVGIPENNYIFSDFYPEKNVNKEQMWREEEETFFSALKDRGVAYIKMKDKIHDRFKEYTKTDHHFSYQGAYRTYKEIIHSINEGTGRNLSSTVDLIEVKMPFRGSYSKRLFYLDKSDDKAYIYSPDFPFERWDSGEKSPSQLFFIDENTKEGVVGYDLYMGGDQAITRIETHREDLPTILVYGDSFTNPLETLLVRNANKFYSADFRYHENQSLMSLIEEINPDIVICVRDNLTYLDEEGNGLRE